jgi:predicted ATPase
VPPTLHASLIARLDRLGGAAREVAQIGAVLGREFSYELIEPVAQRTSAELQNALSRLTEAGLLFCRGVAPNSSYLARSNETETPNCAPRSIRRSGFMG